MGLLGELLNDGGSIQNSTLSMSGMLLICERKAVKRSNIARDEQTSLRLNYCETLLSAHLLLFLARNQPSTTKLWLSVPMLAT